MPTEVIHTLKSTGGDYSSIATWESSEQRNLVSADEIEHLECYKGTTVNGGWQADGTLVEAIVIDGWTTDITRSIAITSADGEGHVGELDTGFTLDGSGSIAINSLNRYVTIQDITLISSGGAVAAIQDGAAGGGQLFQRLIIKVAGGQRGIRVRSTGGIITTVRNCLVYGNASSVAVDRISADAHLFQNNTWAESGLLVFQQGSGDVNSVTSNTVTGTKGGVNSWSGWGNNTVSTNNASIDQNDKGSNPIHDIDLLTAFVDHAGGDYRPAPGGELDGTGIDNSADFLDDITGAIRTQWDVGAYSVPPPAEVIHTLRSSGGDYSLMSTWESEEQRNLVALDEIEILECYDDWPSGLADTCVISGWTVGVNNYTKITCPDGEWHEGVVATGNGFWMTGSNTILQLSQNYCRVEKLRLNWTSTSNSINGVFVQSVARFCSLDKMIITNPSSSGRALRAAAGVTVKNSVFVGRNTLLENGTTDPHVAQNLTIASEKDNNTYAFWVAESPAPTFENIVAISNTGSLCFQYSGAVPSGMRNCASQDATAAGTGAVTGVAHTAGVDFVDAATWDYNIVAGGKLHETGVDLSGTFTDDITGANRVAPWDIGAYENDVAGGPVTASGTGNGQNATGSGNVTVILAGPDVTASGTGNAQSATGIGAIVTVRLASGTADPDNATGSGNADVISLVRTATLTLTDESGTPIPNLSGLKWAWFDQATPDLFLAPTDKGDAETTDGAGILTVDLPNTTLDAGQTGWLTVTDSDGDTATNHKGFAGPTEVS